ncbi:aminoacyl-tRNA hydrolase [Candidatus Gracilibacteria bacterium]|nr:aminoacyl-tRNA hydrolase [Candidatus Gracilibacteria bacterium]MCF7856147.1 aminoacyl-tRNA hydrolase [Candidatus Gracilibacteria bacterium]MCF7896613.1 aminoacyl-tRNA hydrolase [Candidatus Gracilibacteria bacterium]
MKLILGLGNPAEKYASTRHNFGFRALDAFAEQFEFPNFKFDKKFKAEISEKKIGDDKIILVKPQTFMNLSGESATQLLSFYKPHLHDFLTIYDDVDLPFGSLRFREGGSSGGHNGVKSLIQHFGTENFARLKLGTSSELLTVMPTEEFVLGKFSSDEEKAIPAILAKAVAEIEKFLENQSGV